MNPRYLFKLLLSIASIVLISTLVVSLCIGYESLISSIINLSDYPSEKRDVLEGMLSSSRVMVLQGVLFILATVVAVLAYSSKTIWKAIAWFLNESWHTSKGIFQDVNTKGAILVLLLPILASVYFAWVTPVSHDEAFTYVTFTNKPFYYCMMFYPYPNNHVLSSALTNLTEMIPFLPILFKMRIIAIIVSALTWIIGYSFIKRNYSEKTAQFVVGISSTLFMMLFYGFMSRGYGMMCLFFVIALWASFNIVDKGGRNKDWLFFMISSMLGFYAVPSFLYPFVILNLFILIHHYKNIKKQFIYNALTVVGAILLYSPIIIVDGLNALIGNNFVLPIDRMEVLDQLPALAAETLYELSHWSVYITLPILLVSYIASFRREGRWRLKGNRTVLLWLLFVVSPFVLLLLQSVIPFARTFVYYGFILVFLVGISWREYINKIPSVVLLVVVIAFEIASLVNFKLTIGPFEQFNTTGKVINDYILREPDKTYFMAPTYSMSNFNYEYTIKGYDFDKVTVGEERLLSADTINDYDYVVVEIPYDKTIEKKPIFSNEYQNVYKRR